MISDGVCFSLTPLLVVSSTFAAQGPSCGAQALTWVHQHRPSHLVGEQGSLPPASVHGVLGLGWNFICPSLPCPTLQWASGNSCSFVGSPGDLMVHIPSSQRRGKQNSGWLRRFPVPEPLAGWLLTRVCPFSLWVAVLPQDFDSGPVCCSSYCLSLEV